MKSSCCNRKMCHFIDCPSHVIFVFLKDCTAVIVAHVISSTVHLLVYLVYEEVTALMATCIVLLTTFYVDVFHIEEGDALCSD